MGPGVTAVMTARAGGVSPQPWASCNLGDHVGDDPARVHANRQVLARCLPARPTFMTQVHGEAVVHLRGDAAADGAPLIQADGALSTEPGVACVVMVADCSFESEIHVPSFLMKRNGWVFRRFIAIVT